MKLTLICREHPAGVKVELQKGKYWVSFEEVGPYFIIKIRFILEEEIDLFSNLEREGKFMHDLVYQSEKLAISRMFASILTNYIEHFLYLCSNGLIQGKPVLNMFKLNKLNQNNSLLWKWKK